MDKAAREKLEEGFTAVKMNATEELQMIDSYDKIDVYKRQVRGLQCFPCCPER